MKVKEGRKMRINTFRHFFAALLTIAALAAEPCVWAQAIPPTFPVEVTFRGAMQDGKYSCMIFSPLHGSYSYYSQQKDIFSLFHAIRNLPICAIGFKVFLTNTFTLAISI